MKIQNQGFDHVEFVVHDLAHHEDIYKRMGFERIGSRELKSRGLKSTLWAQGFVRILLTQVDLAKAPDTDPRARFLREHGEGICTLAVDVDSAEGAYKLTTSKGARSAMAPQSWDSADGSVARAEVFTPADVRYAFIERKSKTATGAALFDEELVADRLMSPSPFNLRVVDHLTNNVDMGEMPRWVDYYKKVWDFKVVRHFDISTGRTGLTSDVVQSDNRKICVPINQATEPESQVQEFVERFHGAGVQHLALLTTDIMTTLKELRKNGFKFFKIFAPSGVPLLIMPLIVLIEIISFFSRPLSHSVRLWANILAGHILLKVFASFVPMLFAAGGAFALLSVLPLAMTVALYGLEFLVAFLQAYVFALLTCIYLNDALHPGH